MASGFCLRVLLLPVIIYGQLALGNIYRYRSENGPHHEQAGASRTYSPVSSSYDGFVHPRAFEAKFPDGSKVSASASHHEPSHFFSRQVDGYSQRGSVPSYKPASLQSKPSHAQQPQSSFFQGKPRMWETTSQNGRKGSNIVSSGAIVIKAEKTPEQWSSPTSDSRQAGASYTKLPPNHPAFSAPAVLPSKSGMWDSLFGAQSPVKQHQKVIPAPPVPKSKAGVWDDIFASSAQSLGSNHPGRLPPDHPAFSAPAVLQSKAGMWDSLFASNAQTSGSYPPAIFPQIPEPSVKESKFSPWKRVPTSKLPSPGSNHPGRLPPDHPAFSAPAVLQTKINVWDGLFGSSAQSPVKVPQKSTLPQNKPGVWDVASGSSVQSSGSNHPGRLPLNHPVFSAPAVLQSKEGMWDSLFASGAQSPGSFPAAPVPQNPEPQVTESEPSTWNNVATSKLPSPGSNHPGRLPPDHPAFSAPAVLQSKEGMWDSLFASPDIDPRGSRPEASGSYPLSQQKPRPASSTSQSYGGLVDKAALKSSPRSSKTASVSILFQPGRQQQQLASTHGKLKPVAS